MRFREVMKGLPGGVSLSNLANSHRFKGFHQNSAIHKGIMGWDPGQN